MSASAPVVLIGLMGAGKSTVGHALAERTGATFVDTDALVEERSGRTVAELFETEGEQGFRRRELDALASSLDHAPPVVIAAGGGVVTIPEARSLLATRATVVFLDVSAATAAARVGDAAGRPLLAGDPAGRLQALHEARGPLYREVADVIVPVDDRDPVELAHDIVSLAELDR